MHNRLICTGVLLLAACSRSYSAPVSGASSADPEATFDCVKKQLGALGYRQSSIDVNEHRIQGTKIDLESRRSDTQFRRILNRIEVEVAPRADGQTGIEVHPHTFAEYTTQRGPTEVEERPSDEVKTAAQELLSRCRS